MFSKGKASLSPASSSPQPKSKINQIVSEMLESGGVSQAPPKTLRHTPIHFRIFQGDSPLSKARIFWKTKAGKQVDAEWLPRTNKKGWGMISIKTPGFSLDDPLQLDVELNGELKTFHDIKFSRSSKIQTITGSDDLILEINPPGVVEKKPVPEKKRSPRFLLAIVGKPDQLKKAIPLLEGRACFRVKRVFIDGKATRKSLALKKGIEIGEINKNFEKQLEDIQVLFDLTDIPQVKELYQAQIVGEPKTQAIIVPDAKKLLGMADKLIAHFEGIQTTAHQTPDPNIEISKRKL